MDIELHMNSEVLDIPHAAVQLHNFDSGPCDVVEPCAIVFPLSVLCYVPIHLTVCPSD